MKVSIDYDELYRLRQLLIRADYHIRFWLPETPYPEHEKFHEETTKLLREIAREG